jgi:hypothetical protein
MKKPKMVVILHVIADECIEASKALARQLDSRGKESKKKQEDCEVNTRCDDRVCSDRKFKWSFQRPADTRKWCEIHRTINHDLEECNIFQGCKKNNIE